MQKIVRRRPLRQIAWALGIFCLLATGATSAWAKPKVHKSGVSALAERQRQAAQQLRAGREALERGELGAAARDLAASYRTYPDPEVLHQLGLLAIAQRETLVAKDFLRRYLADPNRAKDAEPPSERVRRILEQPISSGAEMRVDGPEGALLLLDGRLVGVLPLSQALLVSAGLHKLVLESEGSRIEGAVTAQPGRLVDARFDQTAEGVLVTMPAAVVLLASMGGVSKENEQIFRQTIERSVRRENLALFDPTLARAKLPADDPRRATISVLNPLESERPALATTLLPGLLEALARNVSRGAADVALFGIEQVVQATPNTKAVAAIPVDRRPTDAELAEIDQALPYQPLHVAAVLTGLREPAGPWGAGRAVEATDALETVQIIARACGVEVTLRAAQELPWHPGRCAEVLVGDTVVGYAGQLHPAVIERTNLPKGTCAVELNLDAIPVVERAIVPSVSPYPAVFQDVSLIVAADVAAQAVVDVVREGAGGLLEDVRLFDVYTGPQIGEGRKSLTLALRFRAPDRTLTEDEASAARDAAVALATERLAAEHRR